MSADEPPIKIGHEDDDNLDVFVIYNKRISEEMHYSTTSMYFFNLLVIVFLTVIYAYI